MTCWTPRHSGTHSPHQMGSEEDLEAQLLPEGVG